MGRALQIDKPTVVDVSVRHILRQIEQGETLAAADHLLVRGQSHDLPIVLQELMAELPDFIREHQHSERNVFTTLIRIGLNLVGRDVHVARIPSEIVEKTLLALKEKIAVLENSWRESANAAVRSYLADMSSVNSGDSLPALLAERIEEELVGDQNPSRFIDSFAEVARQTVYWRMVEEGYCKFGNDYARGLETLRHLGFSQVSTNPVLAAKAFDEDANLLGLLEEQVRKTTAWKQDPRSHGHSIVMAGTLLALWPNLEVFRPLAILSENHDYMISFQLNPNIADDIEASMQDAKRAYKLVQDHLMAYDKCLGIGKPGEMPPNIVFKVAGSSAAARRITRELNASGIGTNNTLTFTVAQEVRLIIEALIGKAEATKARKPVIRTYETNMGGRFVSHLREEEAKRIFLELASRRGESYAKEEVMRLAKGLKLTDQELQRAERAQTIAEKVDLVCAYRNLKSLTDQGFLEVASEAGFDQQQIKQLEMDLRKAGTMVAQRVYSLFYDEHNLEKWIEWLKRNFGLERSTAKSVVDSMDILPASKRIPEDTYGTLASTNMCNTEFPNHAKAVQLYSERANFDLLPYRQAVLQPPDIEMVNRLMNIRDFVRGYESTREISEQLTRAGVLSKFDVLGTGGLVDEDWNEFGPVRKTMNEFREAYDRFFERCVKLASAILE